MRILLPVLIAGCGGYGDGLPRLAVSGKATLAGDPVSGGTLTLVPTGKGPSCGTSVTDGAFLFRRDRGPVAGEYTVRLTPALTKPVVAEPEQSQSEPASPTIYQSLNITITDDTDQLNLSF